MIDLQLRFVIGAKTARCVVNEPYGEVKTSKIMTAVSRTFFFCPWHLLHASASSSERFALSYTVTVCLLHVAVTAQT